MSVGQPFRRWVAILAILATALAGAYARQDVSKSVSVVPKDGPLQGQTVYTGSYALFVGIGDYQNRSIPRIKCAPNDASSMRDVLVKKYGFDPDPDHSVVITDGEATRERINREIGRLCDHNRVKPTDRVFVYFSCHGVGVPLQDGSKVGYLTPYDAAVNLSDIDNFSAYFNSCLDMEDVAKTMRGCPAKHRMIVVDSCFSGFAVGAKGLEGRNYSPDALRNMLDQAGLVVVTAGDDKQEVPGDDSETGLSVFTRCLIESLNAGSINGGTFTAMQLAADAAATTQARSKQTPLYGRKDGSGEMLFFASQPAPAPLPPKIFSAILHVTSTPSGANVLVDGKVFGKTPLSLPIDLITEASKSVEVAVQLDGYLAAGQTVNLTRGATVSFNAPLVAVSVTTPTPRSGNSRAFDLSAPGSQIGDTMENPKDGTVFVWVPGGDFLYGDQKETKHLGGFWIAKNDVTWGQYKKFCQETGRALPENPGFPITDSHPVVNVFFDDAFEYSKWAGCRLPTEEQWEKAARGTDGRAYPWGDTFDKTKCHTSVGDDYDKKAGTAAVGSYPSGQSIYGCLDIEGNVWQWTISYYDAKQKLRVIRGASWSDADSAGMHCASRNYIDPEIRWDHLGFRVAGPCGP